MKRYFKIDYLYAWQGFLISIIAFTIFVLLLPEIELDINVETILTISTFLFGIISAFFISERYSRYEKMRELVAKEISGILSINNFSEGFGKEILDEMRELIDKYMLISMDYELYEYQDKVDKEFNDIEKFIITRYKKSKKGNDQLYLNLLNTVNTLGDVREEMKLLGSDRVEFVQWIVMIALSSATIISSVLFLDSNIIVKIFAILFSSIIVLILLILRDLNNLRWKKEAISIEPFEEVFDHIEKPRYYDASSIVTRRVQPPKDVDYRVSHHKAGEKPDIRLIKAKK